MGGQTLVRGVDVRVSKDIIERNTYTLDTNSIQPKELVFNFKDGTTAIYSLEENDGSLQKFLDRVQSYHDLEKEHERLKKQLKEANLVLKDLELADDIRIAMKVQEYTDKWGVK